MARGVLRGAAVGVLAAVLGCAATLAGGPAALGAPTTITSQSYVKPVQLDRIKEAGWDGAGVTIAVIDGPPDLSVPELAGADVTVIDECTTKPTPDAVAHGTSVLTILANKDWGWAPKAKFLFYVAFVEFPDGDWNQIGSGCDSYDRQMEQAMNEGADIITMSFATPWAAPPTWPLARAIAKGVPVVFAAGNEGAQLTDPNSALTHVSSPAWGNGVVAVGADNLDGTRASFSSWGRGLTIMAPGVDVKVRKPDASGKLTRIVATYGTSLSTPMVAGALALAKQKWPDANGNQLVSSLIDTAVRDWDGWNPGMGYGNFNPWKLLNNDPSKYSTENPLMDKEEPDTAAAYLDVYPGQLGRSISTEGVDHYRDGLADPVQLIHALGDQEYVYRGPDTRYVGDPDFPAAQMQPGTATRMPTPPATPPVTPPVSATPASTPQPASQAAPLDIVWPAVAVGVAAVAVAAVLVAVLATRRRAVRLPETFPRREESDGQGL